MANTITITAIAANTSKTIEYLHPNTNIWQDSNILTGVTAGTYNSIKCRLKTSNPEIAATWTSPVIVTDLDLGTITLAMFGSDDQSNGSGLSPRTSADSNLYNTDSRVITYSYPRNRLETFSLGQIVISDPTNAPYGDVVGANDNSILKLPGYDNGIGPVAGFVRKWKANNPGTTKLAVFTKDLSAASTQSATTVYWISTLLDQWKQEVTGYVNALKAAGYTGINPVLFSGLGEGNSSSQTLIDRFKADQINIWNQMKAHIMSFATSTFTVNTVRMGVVIKQIRDNGMRQIAKLQAQLANEYVNAFLVEMPFTDPKTAFFDGLHYTTAEITRLGEYEASVVNNNYVPPALPAQEGVALVLTTGSDVVHDTVNDIYSTTRRDNSWASQTIDPTPLAANTAGRVNMLNDDMHGLGIVGLHDSLTPWNSYNIFAGLYFEEDTQNDAWYPRSVFANGYESTATRYLLKNDLIAIARKSDMSIWLQRNRRDGTGWVDLYNYNITYSGILYAGIGLLGSSDIRAAVVKPKRNWS